jgi:GTPase
LLPPNAPQFSLSPFNMPLPIVAVIGRPNVGKSALVNRLAGAPDAIVHDEAGVTRDRTYRRAFWQNREFTVVDTGGLVFADDTEFLPLIREQAMMALKEASVAIMVVDGQMGSTAGDEEIASWLRHQPVPVMLAVNKCESQTTGLLQSADFWGLGLGEPFALSSIHGNGTGELLDEMMQYLPEVGEEPEEAEVRIAIIGRPNVGKSSLLNAFLGENRSIVSPVSGTTRDAIDTLLEVDGKRYRLVDTAGIRKKKNVEYGPEFFGINRAFKAIRRADVVLMVLDALDGVTEQDQKLAGRIIEEGRACVVVVNKWDAVEKDSYTIYDYQKEVSTRLNFTDWAENIFVSALSGKRVREILPVVDRAVEQHRRRVSTATINEVLEEATTWHNPTVMRGGKQGKVYYGTQVSTQPPTFALFVNDPARFNDNYRRYLEKQFRQQLGFHGTPVKFLWRGKKQREGEKIVNRATRVKSVK